MKVWLINPYGPIPGESWRDYCFTMMAEALSKAGHEAVWWTSNFSHHFKKFRSEGWKDIRVDDRFIVRLVPTSGYKRNIGLGRIIRDLVFAYRAYSKGKKLAPPDCIIYFESPLSFGYAGQKLARFHRRPVIFHQIDLWPEFFEEAFSPSIRPILRTLLGPVYRKRKETYSQLDAVIGLAKPYLEVPLREAPALSHRPHEVIYNGIDVQEFRRQMKNPLELSGLLPGKQRNEVWAVFAGSLGPSYDIGTLLGVAKRLEREEVNLRLVIAGDGPLRKEIEKMKNTRVHYVGKLPPGKLAPLYALCDIGLCAYSRKSNVEMPDKFYDYTAAGLAIINSLKGEVSDIIREKKIGLQYEAEDENDLYACLTQLVGNPNLRQAMGNNSFAQAALYDRHTQYSKLVKIVEQLSAGAYRPPLAAANI